MKKSCLMLLFLALYAATMGQCDKKWKLKSEKVVKINPDGSVGEEVPMTAQITISKDSIHITLNAPDGNEIRLDGIHKETICKMNADYSEGTVEYKTDAEMNHPDKGKQFKVILFTLESKGGTMKLYGVPADEAGEKICFEIKEKEEVKK